MSENKEYVSRSDELGNIHISEEVLAAITAAAALEVEGVSGLAANLGSDIAELLGKKNLAKGVHVKMEDDKDKGNKKDKKPKEPVPGAYLILNGVAKCTTLKDIKMIGLVVKQEEWEQKVEAAKASNPNVEILYTSAMSARYDFGVTEPPPKVEEEEDPKAKGKTKK